MTGPSGVSSCLSSGPKFPYGLALPSASVGSAESVCTMLMRIVVFRAGGACSRAPVSRLHSRTMSDLQPPSNLRPPTPTSDSDAHHLDDDALPALTVELRVEHLLPGTEIERAAGDRQHHLMTHDRPFEMRVGVVLAGLVMVIRQPGGRQLFEPRLKVLDEAVLPVVDVDAGCDVHGGNEHHAVLHRALLHDRGDLVGD